MPANHFEARSHFSIAVEVGYSAIFRDRKSTRPNSSHTVISYAVFCLKKKKIFQMLEQARLIPRTSCLSSDLLPSVASRNTDALSSLPPSSQVICAEPKGVH